MQIKVTKLTNEDLLRKACSYTIGAESKATLGKMYKCEHSPIRTQLFVVEMIDIPTFVSVHFVRHHVGVDHWVKSNREDRATRLPGSSSSYNGFTGEFFRLLFDYKDGKLYWKESRANGKVKAGDEAGTTSDFDGYRHITIDGKICYRSIITFMMFNDYRPPTVDHIDRVRDNDNIHNLRPATPSSNLANRVTLNPTGFRGVRLEPSGRFSSRITVGGKEKHLGRYASAEEAAVAYDIAALKFFGEFAFVNFAGANRPVTRETGVNHMMLINAQALINLARKRLCFQAHHETVKVMQAIKTEVAKVDQDLANRLVPDCLYRNGCNELKPCGYFDRVAARVGVDIQVTDRVRGIPADD